MSTSTGSIFKRCGCTTSVLDEQGRPVRGVDGRVRRRRLGASCPQLRRKNGAWSPTHGAWEFLIEVATPAGTKRAHISRGGHASREDAERAARDVATLLDVANEAERPATARMVIADLIRAAVKAGEPLPELDELRAKITVGQRLDSTITVEQWLTSWLTAKRNIRRSTRRSYESHIRNHLIPLLGTYRLDRLRSWHVQAAFDHIAEQAEVIAAENAARHAVSTAAKKAWREHDPIAARTARASLLAIPPFRRPTGPATIQRIRATLRSALTDALKKHHMSVNVAKLVDLESGKRPRALVWTEGRVTTWRKDGTIPCSVMVWTAPQTVAFLKRARSHPLYALFMLISHNGLRRGEACGLRWDDVDFSTGQIQIRQQIAQLGWETEITPVKSDAGERTIIAARTVLKALAGWRKTQQQWRSNAGDAWVDTGLVFTNPDGTPLHPAHVTDLFHRLTREADLPPIRLHDVRHGAATYALAADIDIKVVSDMLGHADTHITRDTYQSVLDQLKKDASNAIADLLAAAES